MPFSCNDCLDLILKKKPPGTFVREGFLILSIEHESKVLNFLIYR